LSATAYRGDRCPVSPSNLRGGAAQKVAAKLIADGLLKELLAKGRQNAPQEPRKGLFWYIEQAMKWTYRFPKPIVLEDGRKITSLIQVRDLIVLIPLPHLRNAHWEYATDLIYDAARNGDDIAVSLAYEQLLRALKVEGLL